MLSDLSAISQNLKSTITSAWDSPNSSDCTLLASGLMAFSKAKTTNFECKWVKDMMVRFLPTLSIRTESVRCRRSSNFLHSLSRSSLIWIAPRFDFSNRRPMTNSSPHSIPTPLGPDRLTLAPGRQQLPELSSRNSLYRSHVYEQENQGRGDFVSPLKERPISSRSLE